MIRIPLLPSFHLYPHLPVCPFIDSVSFPSWYWLAYDLLPVCLSGVLPFYYTTFTFIPGRFPFPGDPVAEDSAKSHGSWQLPPLSVLWHWPWQEDLRVDSTDIRAAALSFMLPPQPILCTDSTKEVVWAALHVIHASKSPVNTVEINIREPFLCVSKEQPTQFSRYFSAFQDARLITETYHIATCSWVVISVSPHPTLQVCPSSKPLGRDTSRFTRKISPARWMAQKPWERTFSRLFMHWLGSRPAAEWGEPRKLFKMQLKCILLNSYILVW